MTVLDPMAAPLPPQGPMPPDAGMPMSQPAPDPDEMMGVLLEAVAQKWGQAEMMVDMEKQVLLDTLLQLAMPAPEVGPGDMVEGGMPMGGPPMGPPMGPPPGAVMPGTQMGDYGMGY